ncbi:MAG: complex I NDUFA9 subunit family protein [Alphaproteobacteria bacterium]
MAREIITVFGGSGFLGRNVVRELARAGYRIRVAVRKPHEAHFLQPLGGVGQISLQAVNIRDERSVERALDGASGAVNLVGILYQGGKQRFRALHAEAPGRIGRLATGKGLERVIHISSIGANPRSPSRYARTKAAGERALREQFPQATILRPSIMFGPEDGFFRRFAAMAALPGLVAPVLPLMGGRTKFQPVHVDDVADAVVTCLRDAHTAGRIYELGGPEVLTFREWMELMLEVIERKKPLMPVPMFMARIMGFFMGMLPNPPLTLDQVRQLKIDNVVRPGGEENVGTIQDLGIQPTAAEVILPTYLWRFRPRGQYADYHT